METQLRRTDLTDDRRRIITQTLGKYRPDTDDITRNNLNATAIAQDMCRRIQQTASDPAHKAKTALQDFAAIVSGTLAPVLNDPAVMGDLTAATQKELLTRTQTSGQADRLRDRGITEKAIIRLAHRYAADTNDVSRAWLELQNAMDVAVRVQQEGRVTSNQGDFVDVVLKRVADCPDVGACPGGRENISRTYDSHDPLRQARHSVRCRPL